MALDLPAANRVYKFRCEDPKGEYAAVRAGLTGGRGWTRLAKAKAGDDAAAPRPEAADLVWTLDERTIDHDKLDDDQCANHYRDVATLTTKAGLTRTMGAMA